jgi:hypothetical protein
VYAYGSCMHQKCFNYALTNLLFGLCKFVWMFDSLIIHPSPHLKILACPSTPEVLRTKEHTPTHISFVVSTFGLAFESFKECGGVSFAFNYGNMSSCLFNFCWIKFVFMVVIKDANISYHMPWGTIIHILIWIFIQAKREHPCVKDSRKVWLIKLMYLRKY